MRVSGILAISTLALMGVAPLAAATRPALGDPAPPLQLSGTLQVMDGESATLEGLRGKVVVIEFWSTWCPPCVKAIPHLNELAETLNGEPIRFLSITEEPRERVERFLGRQPMNGWIGFDREGRTARAYGREAMPMTVLVDATGHVQSIVNPRDLTEESLRALIAGERPDLPQWQGASEVLREMLAMTGAEPMLRLFLRPSSTTGGALQMWDQGLAGAGMPLGMILQQAYDLSGARIMGPEELLRRQYDFLVQAPDRALRDRFTREVVELTLALHLVVDSREADVYLLEAGPQAEERLRPSGEERLSSTGRPGKIASSATDMKSFARALEERLGRPVIDETGLPGTYEIVLTWDDQEESGLQAVIEDQLGLRLVPDRREVELLVVKDGEEEGQDR